MSNCSEPGNALAGRDGPEEARRRHGPPRTLGVAILTSTAATIAELARDISSDPGLRMVGVASDPASAYMLVEREEPDVALVGSELCGLEEMDGLFALFRLTGTAAVEVRAPGDQRHLPVSLSPGIEAAELGRILRAARPSPLPGMPPGALAARSRIHSPARVWLPGRMILLGASTGGIDALQTILSAFPVDCPPTAIVQHTGSAFSDSLLRLLDRSCPARVIPARDGISMRPGQVIVAAGSAGHLLLGSGRSGVTRLEPGGPISGHVPSVDALFRSALPQAENVIAALLTGMGRDGAQGMAELHAAGARTLVQDQASSVVWGMPRAARDLGAADLVLPLSRISACLLDWCSGEAIRSRDRAALRHPPR